MMSGEGQEVEMMAAVVGEEYFNHRMKVFCLEANRSVFGNEFLECLQRSSRLALHYHRKISEISMEMNLQEDQFTTDPSYLFPPK